MKKRRALIVYKRLAWKSQSQLIRLIDRKFRLQAFSILIANCYLTGQESIRYFLSFCVVRLVVDACFPWRYQNQKGTHSP